MTFHHLQLFSCYLINVGGIILLPSRSIDPAFPPRDLVEEDRHGYASDVPSHPVYK